MVIMAFFELRRRLICFFSLKDQLVLIGPKVPLRVKLCFRGYFFTSPAETLKHPFILCWIIAKSYTGKNGKSQIEIFVTFIWHFLSCKKRRNKRQPKGVYLCRPSQVQQLLQALPLEIEVPHFVWFLELALTRLLLHLETEW